MIRAEARLEGLRALIDQADRDGDEALAAGLAQLIEEELVWRPRPHQIPPEWDWTVLALIAGRGAGKTDAGASILDGHMQGPPCDSRVPGGHRARIMAPTFGDAIASCVNGPSGLRAHNPDLRVTGGPEGTIITWPNGARASVHGCHSPDDVNRLRAQSNNCADWMEEAAAMRNLEGENGAWTQAQFGRRLGKHPIAIITTTPKNREIVRRWIHTAQGVAVLRWLQQWGVGDPSWEPARRHRIALVTATTADNPHLDQDLRDELYEAYGGTRLGEQELLGRLLEDVGNVFSSAWFGYRTGYAQGPHTLRYWDLAATEPGGANPDPDWTAGARVTYTPRAGIPLVLEDGTEIATGAWNIDDIVRIRASAGQVMQTIVETARRDGPHVRVGIEQDRAQSGKSQVATYRRVLAGIARCEGWLPTGAKLTRATSVAVPAQQGNVTLTRADWNRGLLDELEAFDGGKNGGQHDDQVDALSGAFTVLAGRGNLARVDSAPASARVPTAGGTRPATGRLTGNTRLPRRY